MKSVLSSWEEIVLPLDYVWPSLANGIVEAIQQKKATKGVQGPSAGEFASFQVKRLQCSWRPPVPLAKTPSDKALSDFEHQEKQDVKAQRLERERMDEDGIEPEYEDDDRTALSFLIELNEPSWTGSNVLWSPFQVCSVDNRHVSMDFVSPVHWWSERPPHQRFWLLDETKEQDFPLRPEDATKLGSPEFNSRFALSLIQTLLIRLGSSWRIVLTPVDKSRLATLPARDEAGGGGLISELFGEGSHDVTLVHMDLGERIYVKTVNANGTKSRRLHQDTLLDPARGIRFQPDRPNFIEIPINGFLWFLPSVKSLGDRMVVRWSRRDASGGVVEASSQPANLNEARLTEKVRQERKIPRFLACEQCGEKPAHLRSFYPEKRGSPAVLICSQVCSDAFWAKHS